MTENGITLTSHHFALLAIILFIITKLLRHSNIGSFDKSYHYTPVTLCSCTFFAAVIFF
ncbi:hypothetical protein MN116_008624 [Schistosoma mekongi]|uniref:DUF1656 domain-containing protein n=1 Tax=Schistosoma mekongi TaxID=38744 RepID=A0AAE1Z5M8_SCHME|nr:hypothetical protein MN116_008624 [Schistosoma mekongi]